jgi:hypothetical protein
MKGVPAMTDYPRFRATVGDPDKRHHHYHGALLVDLVFALADWWRRRGGDRQAVSLDPKDRKTVWTFSIRNVMRRSI